MINVSSSSSTPVWSTRLCCAVGGGGVASACLDCSQYLPCFVGVSSSNLMRLLFVPVALFSLFVMVYALFLGVVVGLISVGSVILRFT